MAFPFDRLIDSLEAFYRKDFPLITRVAEKHRDPFLVLTSCLLSLRTKDEVTDRAVERLHARARTPREIASLPEEELEKLIYPVGFYRNKARILKEVSRALLERYQGRVPDSLDELLEIRGIGRKTANIVITEAFGKPGIAVDTHVHRISNRLGAVRTRNPEETEKRLREVLPAKYWLVFNRLLVTHGQQTCTPLSPFCSRCPVAEICARAGVSRSR